MTDQTKPIYVGNAKQIYRDGREPFIAVDLDLTALDASCRDHVRIIRHRDGEHEHVNLIVAPLKPENVTQHRTHSVKIDTWKPDPSYKRDSRPDRPVDPSKTDAVVDDAAGDDDVPF